MEQGWIFDQDGEIIGGGLEQQIDTIWPSIQERSDEEMK